MSKIPYFKTSRIFDKFRTIPDRRFLLDLRLISIYTKENNKKEDILWTRLQMS